VGRWPGCALLVALLASAPLQAAPHVEPDVEVGAKVSEPGVPGALAQTGNRSRFERTVLHVQMSGASLRAEFARTALRELASVLSAEVDLVEGELADSAQAAKLRGWAAAVRQYQAELARLQADIEQGYEVQLAPGDGGGMEVRVDRRTIIATHPRPGHQALLEQAILGHFCASQDCEQFTAAAVSQDIAPIPVSRGDVRPNWQFGPDGPVCEHRSLALHFSDSSGIARFRGLCQQFLQEAVRLVDEIAWQQRHEVTVQWSGLAISASPGRPEHVVRLNSTGDSVLLTIPLIHSTEGLLNMLVPWLRSEVAQSRYRLELQAVKLGWEGSQGGN